MLDIPTVWHEYGDRTPASRNDGVLALLQSSVDALVQVFTRLLYVESIGLVHLSHDAQ